MLKEGIEIVKKNGLKYLYVQGKIKKYRPWLGNIFSFMYDNIMKKSIFPKKFEASIEEHTLFMKKEFEAIHQKTILELATGTGNIVEMLGKDNSYIGTDVSEGLLKQAEKKLKKAGFKNYELYVSSAEELPFKENIFDICVCNLALNFFSDLDTVICEVKRVIKKNGKIICSVPVPERNKKQNIIRGKLFSENELKEKFTKHGFIFEVLNFENGAILYFEAVLTDK